MRDLRVLNAYRCYEPWVMKMFGSFGNHENGVFSIPYAKTGITLKVIAASGEGWDHVSVSASRRTPNWYEMQYIHQMFFKADEMAWEYHMPLNRHISRVVRGVHVGEHTLHLWRKHSFEMPVPPEEFI